MTTPVGRPQRRRGARTSALVAGLLGASALTALGPGGLTPAAAEPVGPDGVPGVTGNGGYAAPYFTTGDVTGDDAVTEADLDLVGPAIGTTSDDPGWADLAPADLDGDGELDLTDLADLAQRVLYDDGAFGLVEAGALDMQRAMNAGATTSVELTRAYLDRIAAYDGLVDADHARALNSIITVGGEAALEAAAASDAARAENGGPRSMVDGVPVLLKDNYDTLDLPTSAGHGSWEANRTSTDAFMVAGLRAGGAVVLGKASMDEWAQGFASAFTAGVPAGSSTLVASPYDLGRTAGGSSGGTGASIAANLGGIGFGTDTGGSIRVPASYNQLVGIRPTLGLASRDGIVPLALSQDTGGPMARDVSDAALALDEVVGVDRADPVTREQRGLVPGSYTEFLDPDALDGARFGFVASMRGTNPTTTRLFDRAVADLEARGAEVVEVAGDTLASTLAEPSGSTNEFKHDLNGYIGTHLDPTVETDSLRRIIDSGRLVPGRANAYETRDRVTRAQYHTWMSTHLAAIATGEQVTTALLDDNELDALVYPSGNPYSTQGTNLRLSPNTGMPSVTVPMGQASSTEAIPGAGVNLEFLGRNYSEGDLLGMTYAYEQATAHRTAPALYPALPGTPSPEAEEVGPASVGDVRVEVSDTAPALGDEVTVTIAADSVEDLYAYDLGLAFDDEVLSLVEGSVEPGTAAATYAALVDERVDEGVDGGVDVTATRLGTSPSLDGEPVLATLVLEAVGLGSSDVAVTGLEQVGSDLSATGATGELGAAAVTVEPGAAPVATEGPRVTGTARPGQSLATDGATWDVEDVEESYRWLRDGVAIPGETGSSYDVAVADVGTALSVRVTAVSPTTSGEGVAQSGSRRVRPAFTSTRVFGPSPVGPYSRPWRYVRVVANGVTPEGVVDVRYRGRQVADGLQLDASGRTRLRLPRAGSPGRYPLRVLYDPAPAFMGSRDDSVVRVTR